jgi:hypothetical protein
MRPQHFLSCPQQSVCDHFRVDFKPSFGNRELDLFNPLPVYNFRRQTAFARQGSRKQAEVDACLQGLAVAMPIRSLDGSLLAGAYRCRRQAPVGVVNLHDHFYEGRYDGLR